jgi:hypothetical protein
LDDEEEELEDEDEEDLVEDFVETTIAAIDSPTANNTNNTNQADAIILFCSLLT